MSGPGRRSTTEPVRAGAPAARQRSSHESGSADTRSEFLGLQQQVGNRATHRLLAPLRAVGGDAPHADEVGDALRLQAVVGNRAVARALGAMPTGAQDLRVAPADGAAEAQADAVARGVETTITPGAGGDAAVAATGVRALLAESGSAGQPLPDGVRADLERRLGYDLGQVRMHTGANAHAAADALGAHALTVGADIYLGRGADPASAAGRRLLAHEATHVVQQGGRRAAIQLDRNPGTRTQGRDPRFTNDPVSTAISEARTAFPSLEAKLTHVRVRAVTRKDRTEVRVENVGSYVYPTQIAHADEGFYLFEWDASGNYTVAEVINLETGSPAATNPDVHMLAGTQELAELRKQRIGVIWITMTVTEPPKHHDKTPDELEIPLDSGLEISADDYRRLIVRFGRVKLTIPGLTGGVFEPEHEYPKPLNFRYETQDGQAALVTRKLVGREFHYAVPIRVLSDYLRAYPFEYAGVSAGAWLPIYKLLFEVGITFVPIIGPLIMLYQAGETAVHLYKHWHEMSGWEKGLAGLQILLSVVPAVKTARSIVKGAAAYKEGVSALVHAGLPEREASRLMLGAGVLQSEKATMQIVDTLGDALRRGERLTAAQLSQLQSVFTKMLQRLPTAERLAIEASFATADLRSLREFVPGVEFTEQHLVGLRRLSPEVLVAFRQVAKAEPIVIQRAATMAAASEEVAAGINALQWSVKPSHLAVVAANAGEDVLANIGRHGGIPDKLVGFVMKARSATNAYERLMQGSARLKIEGLNDLLIAAEKQPLGAELTAVRNQFAKHYLSPDQLHAIARLSAPARAAFTGASARQLRALASTLGGSSGAVAGVEHLAAQLGAAASKRLMPALADRLGAGVLDAAGSLKVTLSNDLLKAVALEGSESGAAHLLLYGFKPRRAARIPGLFDEIAGRLPSGTAAEAAIAKIEVPSLRGELFARWALRSPGQLRAISPEVADGVEALARLRPTQAQDQISRLFRAFDGDQAVVNDFLKSVGQIDKVHGGRVNVDRIVAELAAGGAKSMGASLTLSFAARRAGSIEEFEHVVTDYGVRRQYDLAADGLLYEFKYWRGFGGHSARQAADEFARDVILHARENFGRLRWVVAKNATGTVPAIESMMRGVLSRPSVRKALELQGISVAEATKRLQAALKANLITFY